MKNLGIVILLIGLVNAIKTGFNYATKEKVADMGNLEIAVNIINSVARLRLIAGGIRLFGIEKAQIHLLQIDPKDDAHDNYKLFKAKFDRNMVKPGKV